MNVVSFVSVFWHTLVIPIKIDVNYMTAHDNYYIFDVYISSTPILIVISKKEDRNFILCESFILIEI